MNASTRAASGEIGGYVDHMGMRHQVHVHRVDTQAWEIADVPERGEPTVIERLSGEFESDKTAVAVGVDYLDQALNPPGGSRHAVPVRDKMRGRPIGPESLLVVLALGTIWYLKWSHMLVRGRSSRSRGRCRPTS
jgi:hypothetical protein